MDRERQCMLIRCGCASAAPGACAADREACEDAEDHDGGDDRVADVPGGGQAGGAVRRGQRNGKKCKPLV